MSITNTHVSESNIAELQHIFELQLKNQYQVGNSSVRERREKLKRLHEVFLKYQKEIHQALHDDFRKHSLESDLTEIYPVTQELKHARRRLGKWLGNNRRKTPLAFLGASSRIKYEPKGVVLIISPWNFPINLSFGPLVSAIAAGNCVMLKPSEMTPHSSAIIKKIVQEVFDESEVAVVEGGVETSKSLLELPFNHIFFTGSPEIGKVVMQAAAKNLASVTLELGGKSPTIVDDTANVEQAARRIAWGKFANNGQVCIAPDYVLVHESQQTALQEALIRVLKEFYGEDASQEPSYNRIVNQHHYDRLKSMLADTFQDETTILEGGKFKDEEHYLSPTLVTDVKLDSRIMEEEIFGPILPIIPFKTLDEAIQLINQKEKPLGLYIYSQSKSNINTIISNTRAGGTCVNHNEIQYFNPYLGFGGSNNSGIGRGHGDEGFKAFSNPRGIMTQHIPNALDLLTPPYNNFKQRLIDFTIKWL